MLLSIVYLLSWTILPFIAKKRGNLNLPFILVLIFFGPFATIFALRKSHPLAPRDFKIEIPKVDISLPETSSNEYQYVPPKDERKPICPNCKSQLKKIPGAKTRCSSCRKYMLVRTDPHSRTRIVVTEDQAIAIDDEVARLNGTYEQKLAERNRRDEIRKDLKESFRGIEPSKEDIEWRIMNQDSIKYARQGDWVSYGINRNAMANALEVRGKFKEALNRYFEVIILDLTGIQDFSGAKEFDAEMRKLLDIRQFKPEEGKLHDEQITNILRLAKELKVNNDTLESLFHEAYKNLKYIKFPLSSEDCWAKIAQKIGSSL